MKNAIDDGVGAVVVVQDLAPVLGVFVGREDHRALLDVALVDNVEEDVGRVVTVGEVADLVDEEQVRLDVAHERFAQATVATRGREIVDEVCCGGDERVEAVLQGVIGDGDGEVRLAATRLAIEDDGTALRDEVGREQRTDGRDAQRGLVGEVELLDGA